MPQIILLNNIYIIALKFKGMEIIFFLSCKVSSFEFTIHYTSPSIAQIQLYIQDGTQNDLLHCRYLQLRGTNKNDIAYFSTF